jgi:exonuclease III
VGVVRKGCSGRWSGCEWGWRVVAMKIISYNVRGLGGFEKRAEVRRLVQEKNPYVVCLQESKLDLVDGFTVKSLWGTDGCGYSFQASVGAAGGLITMWDSSVVEVWCTMSFRHVLIIKGKVILSGEEFIIANVYAPCDISAKRDLWRRLSQFVLSIGDANICVCGDFNSVRMAEERRGRNLIFRQVDADIFNNFIDGCFLLDLPICGRLYTWYRGDGISMSRIDRFLVSAKWCESWPNCIQVAHQRGLSDHVPLVLYVDESNWGPRPLRLMKCWSEYVGYGEFVREKLNNFSLEGWGGHVLKMKLKMIKSCLKEWHQKHSKNIDGKISEVKNRISLLDTKGEESELMEEETTELRELSVELHSMSRVLTSMNWQKARMSWVREGDANSKFFHNMMSRRQRRNSLHVIHVDGVSVGGVQNIRTAVLNHFANHYRAHDVVRPGIDGLNFRKLSGAHAGNLVRPFTVEEVKQAVWDCDSFKSPGPGGINVGFIKDFWHELKDDFLRFFVEFHRNGKLTKGVNSTFIALIPKVDSPQRLADFRPISLVGCMYKVLAKVLANRLRHVLDFVVSDAQSAFVSGKQILDGILIANEVVDEARCLNKELLLFKVDFEKAYDSIDLNYLNSVMVNMNFPTLWRKWIMECVGTATAAVLVNGCPTEEFPIQRGLRQGDPLSPFLFLLAAEGFDILMKASVSNNIFQPYCVGPQGEVKLSHLQFADDTLILGVKSWMNVRTIRAVLLLLEDVSGLKVNFNKSMLTGVNISSSWLTEAAAVLNCKTGSFPFVYLGLPIGGDSGNLIFGNLCWIVLPLDCRLGIIDTCLLVVAWFF